MMYRTIVFLVATAGFTAACAQTESTQNEPAAGMEAAVDDYARAQGILTAKCAACHGSEKADAGLRLDSWDHIVRGSQHGEALIAFDADNSLMIELATKRVGGSHPGEAGADTLTASEVDALRRWIADGARSAAGSTPYASARNLVYVCNQAAATVSVIDADANVVIRNVDLRKLGYGPMAKPHHVAVEPGGDHWYVSLIGENRVLKFTRDNKLVGEVEFEVPGMLVFDASSDLLYAGRSMSAVNPPTRIGVINTKDMSADEIDVFVPRPHALAVAPDGKYVYSASLAQNTVVAVNAETYEATLTDMGGPVQTLGQFAMSSDGTMLGAGGQLSGKFLRFDIAGTPSVAVTDSLTVGGMPWHPVFSPDGLLYVPNKGMNSVAIIDLSKNEVVNVLKGNGLSQPHGSAVSSDGRYVYVSNNNMKHAYKPRHDLGDNGMIGTVVVIDIASREIVKVIEVENGATGVGAVPAG